VARPTAHVPTPSTRKLVKGMTGIGIKQDDICLIIEISPHTLRRHYAKEIKTGMAAANAAVGGALFTLATNAGPGQVSAAIFWSKVRMGWQEKPQQHEHSGPDGKPIEIKGITFTIIRPGETDTEAATDQKAKAGKKAR
jgi:hypothetical protein